MYAVEFETVVDGNIIHIPKSYKEFDSQNVKVILMIDSKDSNQGKRIPGTAKGRVIISDDFELPLDKETTELFYQ